MVLGLSLNPLGERPVEPPHVARNRAALDSDFGFQVACDDARQRATDHLVARTLKAFSDGLKSRRFAAACDAGQNPDGTLP